MDKNNLEIMENKKENDNKTKDKINKARTVNRLRNKNFALKFTEEELEEINKKIEISNLSKTDFILKCVRDENIFVVNDLSLMLVEFRKQGININQMARTLNEISIKLKKKNELSKDLEFYIQMFNSQISVYKKQNKEALEILNSVMEKVI